jgi:hypothetical protein
MELINKGSNGLMAKYQLNKKNNCRGFVIRVLASRQFFAILVDRTPTGADL